MCAATRAEEGEVFSPSFALASELECGLKCDVDSTGVLDDALEVKHGGVLVVLAELNAGGCYVTKEDCTWESAFEVSCKHGVVPQ